MDPLERVADALEGLWANDDERMAWSREDRADFLARREASDRATALRTAVDEIAHDPVPDPLQEMLKRAMKMADRMLPPEDDA